MAGLAARVRSNPHLRFLTPSILVDWGVVLLLGQATYYVEQIYPYERDPAHYLNDPDLQWPHGPERVPAYPGSLLDQLTWYLPILVILLVGGLFKRSLHDVHHGILGLSASRAFMRMIVECIKNRVGRLRPDFFSRCQWDAVAHACTDPLALVKDGRRSFPSGHSSTAWQGLFFLSLYLAGKNGAYAFAAPFPRSGPLQSRLLRLWIVLAPLFIAGWIVITRLEDHYHHPTDVLAGSFIGALSAFFSYLTYYPSPIVLSTPPGSEEAEERLRDMERPKWAYGIKEAGVPEGWDEGERVEEGRVRLDGGEGEAVV
ncbi:lipid phosphate phosphatase 1 [Rhodotorula toruloides]|uniref:Lipid phosphate phosphatase 1 n=1 Tax=Rhodotorula toruloides TaxID=5286 RepID=A0A511KE15_RHOTO|nr:lipid phosphate phosphatase 1 [Rhodotorula toruloides]